MKHILKYSFFIVFIISCIVFSGCSDISEIEKSKLVTACMARCNNGTVVYKFYVSVPEGQNKSENGSGTSEGKIYEFEADNFSDAVNKFRHTVSGKIDLGHLSLFVVEPEYMDIKYKNDFEYVSREIKTTPMMYYCMSSSDDDVIFEYISSECRGNSMRFTENMFQNRNRYLACTATELHFSCENKYYTAAIPVIEISGADSASVAVHDGVYIYSQISGTFFVSGYDFETYKLCRKKLYNSEKLYNININTDKIWIEIDAGIDESNRICEFANRYSAIGFDLLNCIYYSKKKFLTYNSYMGYANKLYAQNLNFITGGK